VLYIRQHTQTGELILIGYNPFVVYGTLASNYTDNRLLYKLIGSTGYNTIEEVKKYQPELLI
jgi:hypothetical protein